MYFERLLALITGAFVALCLGLGLTMMAMGPGRKAAGIAGAPQVTAAAPAPEAEPAPPPEEPAPPRAEQEPPAPPPPVAETSPREKVETAIAAAPEYKTFFTRLRDAFPAEYNAAVDDFAEQLAAGKREPNADFYLSDAVRRLRQARGGAAGKAESKPLSRVFEMQLEVLKAVATVDKKMCVAFLYGATNLDFQRFAAGRRKLLADMAAAGLEAIVSGESKKVARGAPTEADFNALEAALVAKGLGKREISALLDGKTPDPPIDDGVMCAAGQTYFEVLRALPEAARSRIYGLAVELMSKG